MIAISAPRTSPSCTTATATTPCCAPAGMCCAPSPARRSRWSSSATGAPNCRRPAPVDPEPLGGPLAHALLHEGVDAADPRRDVGLAVARVLKVDRLVDDDLE